MPWPRWSGATSTERSSVSPRSTQPRATPTTSPRRRAATTIGSAPLGTPPEGIRSSPSGHDADLEGEGLGIEEPAHGEVELHPAPADHHRWGEGGVGHRHPAAGAVAGALLLEEVDPVERGVDHVVPERREGGGDALGRHLVGQGDVGDERVGERTLERRPEHLVAQAAQHRCSRRRSRPPPGEGSAWSAGTSLVGPGGG